MSLEHFQPDRHSSPRPEGQPPSREARLEATRETAEHILTKLESLPFLTEHADITNMYRTLPSEQLIVRREDPERLMETLTTDSPLEIQFVGNSPYANSVVWNPRQDGTHGLDNAILEGYGHLNHVVLVYGFTQPEGFYLKQHPESSQVFAGVHRLNVRTAAGLVPRESIRFVTMRIPIEGFPEERMTEEEKDRLWEYHEQEPAKRTPAFIYRGFLVEDAEGKEKAADLPMAA